jgi:glucose uptake protein GlcU
MKKNMGLTDRIVRIVVAVIIAVLYFSNQITGVAAIILGVVALIFLLTGFVSFCPIYASFKFSTAKKDKK